MNAAGADAEPEQLSHILYIEDNPSNLKLVTRILARWPSVKLHTATDGTTGLALAAEIRPNLVLLDLNLPDIDGDEILRRLKSDPETSEIPVVVLTADATQAQNERSTAVGADGYLTKPLKLQSFLETLVTHLGG